MLRWKVVGNVGNGTGNGTVGKKLEMALSKYDLLSQIMLIQNRGCAVCLFIYEIFYLNVDNINE